MRLESIDEILAKNKLNNQGKKTTFNYDILHTWLLQNFGCVSSRSTLESISSIELRDQRVQWGEAIYIIYKESAPLNKLQRLWDFLYIEKSTSTSPRIWMWT